jgi:hypothetical protein
MSKKQCDIEQDEKNVLEDFEKGEFNSVDNLDQEMQLAKKAFFIPSVMSIFFELACDE